MLQNLTERLSRVVKTMRGQARITEANVQDSLREIRVALLEADVALPVVKDFIAKVKDRAMGEEVIGSLTPGQALVGVVQRELTAVMGGDGADLNLARTPPVVVLMAGLQGSGKTTTTGKLAKLLRERHKKKVLAVSCDVYRPAAIEQLRTVATQAGADVFPSSEQERPIEIARAALEFARTRMFDALLVDTAGRLAIDAAMMDEIKQLSDALQPAETLFVVDAMQGQDAVNVARAFNDAIPLTGVVLTKLDGDSRGGAALSVRHVTGKPIKFVGVNEKLSGLEPFHPERMASSILGMGDVLGLVEHAKRAVDEKEAQQLAQKLKTGRGFDLNDFRGQITHMRKMGGISALIDKLPFDVGGAAAKVDEKAIGRIEAILGSMTPLERRQPELIKASRKRRIAGGSGTSVQEVNRLLQQFEQAQKMMKTLSKGGAKGLLRSLRGGFPGMR